MSETHTIRPYEPHDLRQLVELVRELQVHEVAIFDRMKPPEDIGEGYVEHLLSQCQKHAGTILVADGGSALAGYATVMTAIQQDDPDEIPYVYAMVGDLVVSDGQRGKGLGARLLSECEAVATGAGARWLRLSVLAGNTRAHALYQRHGFADRLIDMEKPL